MSVLTAWRKVTPEKMQDKLLLREYKMTMKDRILMWVWGAVLVNSAIPVGSAIYYLFTQVKWTATDSAGETGTWWLKDMWDRLPIHVQNVFGASWFGDTQEEPAWWVVARHDFRHVLIGLLAVLITGAFLVSPKPRKRRTVKQMVLSVPLAMLAATAVAGVLIWFFAWHPIARAFNHFGAGTHVLYVGDLIGVGTIQLTLIGVAAGFAAKKILAPTFYTLQGMSIDRNIAQGDKLVGWRKHRYPPNYRKRFAYTQALVDRGKHVPQLGSSWMGVFLTSSAPIFAFFLAYGIWLLYWGPASHISKG